MPEIISEQDARYSLEIVTAICQEVGPGLPGSPQERERGRMLEQELQAHLGIENVAVEDFTFAPGAFLGAQLISTSFMLIAALLNISIGRIPGASPWAMAAAAFTFSFSAVLLFVLEFLTGHEVIDRFFKKKRSVNIIGTLRKPESSQLKRVLILSGHHDSALEFTWLRYTGYGFFILTVTWILALISILVMSGIQLAGVITGNTDIVRMGTLGWALLAYPVAPSMIFAFFYTRGRENGGVVPGAADNLSACALAVAMCRFLAKHPECIPADTEIRFISFGSEEAGYRGSRRYVRRHLDELKRMDARVLNFETIAHAEITILTSETNGTVKNSAEMVESVIAAAQRAGIPYKVQPALPGTANDAGPFSRAGIKATTLLGFKLPQMVAFYHQKWDAPEVLSIEPLFNVLALTLEWVRGGGE